MSALSVKEIKKQRFQFLHKLYEMSTGNEITHVSIVNLATEVGLDLWSTQGIRQYLAAEGLIRDESGDSPEFISKGVREYPEIRGGSVSITHAGIKEVEQAIENPQLSTEHFPPNVIYIMGNVTNSPIQQASDHAYQTLNINENQLEELEEIIKLLNEIVNQSSFEGEHKEELKAEVRTVEAQMNSPRPRIQTIKESLSYAKTILEDVSGTLSIITKIATWINSTG